MKLQLSSFGCVLLLVLGLRSVVANHSEIQSTARAASRRGIGDQQQDEEPLGDGGGAKVQVVHPRVFDDHEELQLHEEGGDEPTHKRIRVASFRPTYVDTPMIIGAWIIIAGLTKIGFHVTPKISLICPESCLLIVVGVLIGLLLFYAGLSNVGPLTPNIFFLYMLPPIVLDAGYFMPNRPFFDNLVTILLFAVVGTVFNALSVGISLWAVGLTGLYGVDMPLLDTLLFGSIACAVDPIAVLAVFEEIHVNEVLYILVFGESLLNDAVTVVLYHMFENYAEMGPENIIAIDYLTGAASFFVVAFGGTVMGIFWGLLAAFVSRFTHHVRVIEPLFVFVMSYLSYMSAELFHFSGILSLTFCGMTMKNYVEENISYKSHVTVKYAMKMLSSCSETIIFLFLGVSTVNDSHEWNTWFVLMTLLFCTIYRALGVLALTGLANRFRLHRINKVEQFIMAYGGLRGAVAFALVLIVSEKIIPTKNIMVTTIIALVFFTVFLQGMTIGPLVRILNVKTSNKLKLSMNERIMTKSMDHLMAAVEDIVGQKMGTYHLRDKFKYYNNRYLRPLLIRDHHANAEPKIFETYSKLNLADAMDMVRRNNSGSGLGGSKGMSSEASFSSLFKTFDEQNSSSVTNGEIESQKANVDSNFLNVDIAELEYSPTHRDIADAELHHILADAMARNNRRRRSSRILPNHRKASTDSNCRPHSRYFSYHQRSRRYRSSRFGKSDAQHTIAEDNMFLAPPTPTIPKSEGASGCYKISGGGESHNFPPCTLVISPPPPPNDEDEDDDGIFFTAAVPPASASNKTVDVHAVANPTVFSSITSDSEEQTPVHDVQLDPLGNAQQFRKWQPQESTIPRNRRYSDPLSPSQAASATGWSPSSETNNPYHSKITSMPDSSEEKSSQFASAMNSQLNYGTKL